MEQTELTFWLTSDRRIKYYKHCTKNQIGLVTGFRLMRSMLFYMIQVKHSWSLKQTKTLFKVLHFIYIDLEQAILRKTGWTNVIRGNLHTKYDECSGRSWYPYRMPYKWFENDFSKISVKTYKADAIAIVLGFTEQFLGAMSEIQF